MAARPSSPACEPKTIPLSKANRQQTFFYVVEVDGVEADVKRLASMGLSAGTCVQITNRFQGGVTLVVNGSIRLAVDGRLAERIIVNAVA